MKPIRLTINGQAVTADVEPRTHLADLIRDTLNLTGTHLGCEHGVCGACTLLVDGTPVRSCITLAVACDGASVTTIEGLDADEIAGALRAAFSREHALQCGYCTPGMLAAARDVVMRLPEASEEDVRHAMSGNLCRCTGYVGIVRAIASVIAERRQKGVSAEAPRRSGLGPAGAGHAPPTATGGAAAPRPVRDDAAAGDARPVAARTRNSAPGTQEPRTTLRERFTIDHPRAEVWAFFDRLGEVTTCLPGTALRAPPTDDHVEIRMRVKAGPILAEFDGAADVVRDASNHTGLIRGSAEDARSRSITRGEIRYALLDDKDGSATRVEIEMGFTLTGPLAQFSRSSLVRDIARRMTEVFARNLRARLDRGTPLEEDNASEREAPAIEATSILFSVIWQRVSGFFRRLFGR